MAGKDVLNIPENVLNFLNRCSQKVARFEEQSFSIDSWQVICDLESPIEQILYIALKAVQQFNYIPEMIERGRGLALIPQCKIGNYRVDFEARWNTERGQTASKFVIECDSQEFHERTEPERRYEKKRDRFLIFQGYKILHYTGKEILENPLNIAAEILHLITKEEIDSDWE